MEEFMQIPPEFIVMEIYENLGVKLSVFSIYIMYLDGIKTIN